VSQFHYNISLEINNELLLIFNGIARISLYYISLLAAVLLDSRSVVSYLVTVTHFSRRLRWAVHVARMQEETKIYKRLLVKPERKRPLGRPKSRWEDGIRMNHSEIGWGRRVDSVVLVNTVMNLRVLVPRSYMQICNI
jgi:hypothetical protein